MFLVFLLLSFLEKETSQTMGGNAPFSFFPMTQKGRNEEQLLSPVCWYPCLRMLFTAVVVPMLVLLTAEVFYT